MTHLLGIRLGDPARLIRDTRGVLQNRERVQGQKAGRRREQCECLGPVVRRVGRGALLGEQRTSGRCSSTGSFVRMRACNTSRMHSADVPASRLIRPRASSNHARTSVRRASSPRPKSAVTAASGSGSAWGCGRSSTARASAARVNPCVLTSGTASCNKRAVVVISEKGTTRLAARRSLLSLDTSPPFATTMADWGTPLLSFSSLRRSSPPQRAQKARTAPPPPHTNACNPPRTNGRAKTRKNLHPL